MAGSRAPRLRRQRYQQGQQAHKDQLKESTTYSDLLATTIPANSSQSAAKVARTLGIVQDVSYPASSPALPQQSEGDNAAQRVSKLEDTALYHEAIKPNTTQPATKMAELSKEVEADSQGTQQPEANDDKAIADKMVDDHNDTDDETDDDNTSDNKMPVVTSVPASQNRNCGVTIWNLPKNTTEPMIIEAITAHSPIGKVYACDVYVIPGPNNVPPAMAVASVRFMGAESATRLVLIGNDPDPEKGIFVKGQRAKIRLACHHQPAYLSEPASRVVIFRGPRAIVNPVALRKLWGTMEQTEKLIIGKVEKGICEIEWRFCAYAYNAEPAFHIFQDLYGEREDCSVREVVLVDVGSGLGHSLQELKAKHPSLPGTFMLQDRVEVINTVTSD
ncbi:hypothetical protein KVR01_008018 [Diaporthe batatas]|uniref:uncharacterized protein n=1 Tax=Diaporthe batatas TaxID=748121 RepID=UPI001D05BFC3|nr:uncharacterized protein KVR01_008018 [Diaporthe batatas]KAG8162253.1 hypothetical protein KVR01_008018 [Diaporthe batatas]